MARETTEMTDLLKQLEAWAGQVPASHADEGASAMLALLSDVVEAAERANYFWFVSENRAHPSFKPDYRCSCVICGTDKALADLRAKLSVGK